MTGLAAIKSFDAGRLTRIGARLDEAKGPGRIGGFATDPRTTRRIERRRTVRLLREQAAAEQIGKLPAEREDVVMILTGNYHGFDILAAILELAGPRVKCDELWIATLGFNRSQTDTLAEMLDAGRIRKLHFVISHMFTEKNIGEHNYLERVLKSRGHRIANTRNHAKLMLIKLSDGRHIVTHGSLNLRRCNSFEQLVITQDRQLYRFFSAFLEDAITGGLTP